MVYPLVQASAMKHAQEGHAPVLLQEVLDGLSVSKGGCWLDGTFGGGGHTLAILQAHPDNRVTAIDRDPDACIRAQELKEQFADRFTFVRGNFSELGERAKGPWDGVLLDLGVSSFQLDQADRGFSFRESGPLDMRMDPEHGVSARDWLANVDEDGLVRVLREYGEERLARPIARSLLTARDSGKLESTTDLAEAVERAIPARLRYQRSIHPATLTFQAIRIAVNREMEELERVLPVAFEQLAENGKLAIISFHSLEDRMVKRFFRRMAGMAESRWDSTPADFRTAHARILTPKPIEAGEEEINRNPRSRSARLRILQKGNPNKHD
jgi:16S rRNA (cytosine1402-N4)-methyltransferase